MPPFTYLAPSLGDWHLPYVSAPAFAINKNDTFTWRTLCSRESWNYRRIDEPTVKLASAIKPLDCATFELYQTESKALLHELSWYTERTVLPEGSSKPVAFVFASIRLQDMVICVSAQNDVPWPEHEMYSTVGPPSSDLSSVHHGLLHHKASLTLYANGTDRPPTSLDRVLSAEPFAEYIDQVVPATGPITGAYDYSDFAPERTVTLYNMPCRVRNIASDIEADSLATLKVFLALPIADRYTSADPLVHHRLLGDLQLTLSDSLVFSESQVE